MKIKVARIFCLSLLIISIFALSETFYIAKNRPDISSAFFFWLAKKTAKMNASVSIFLLEKTAVDYSKIAEEPGKQYMGLFNGFGENKIDMNPKFLNSYKNYIASLNQDLNITEHLDQIAAYYYKIGVLAYYGNEPELSRDLMRASTHIYPVSGYNHIEHANLFLTVNDYFGAKAILDKCYNYLYAKSWCENYRDFNLYKGGAEKVGFLDKFALNPVSK